MGDRPDPLGELIANTLAAEHPDPAVQRMIRVLFADNLRLRGALRVVASNMRALEDGGCDYPRVVESFSVANAALSASVEAPSKGASDA